MIASLFWTFQFKPPQLPSLSELSLCEAMWSNFPLKDKMFPSSNIFSSLIPLSMSEGQIISPVALHEIVNYPYSEEIHELNIPHILVLILLLCNSIWFCPPICNKSDKTPEMLTR